MKIRKTGGFMTLDLISEHNDDVAAMEDWVKEVDTGRQAGNPSSVEAGGH